MADTWLQHVLPRLGVPRRHGSRQPVADQVGSRSVETGGRSIVTAVEQVPQFAGARRTQLDLLNDELRQMRQLRERRPARWSDETAGGPTPVASAATDDTSLQPPIRLESIRGERAAQAVATGPVVVVNLVLGQGRAGVVLNESADADGTALLAAIHQQLEQLDQSRLHPSVRSKVRLACSALDSALEPSR